MSRRREKQLDAYRDGALSDEQRARVERELETDAECAERIHQTDLLGRAIRESWTEGPAAPLLSHTIQAIRPALREIDAEISARSSLWRLSAHLGDWLRPAPVAALAAAALVVLVLTRIQPAPVSPVVATASLIPLTTELAWADSPEAVYDLEQEGAPLMVFEGVDGSTIFWILDDDGVSLSVSAKGCKA
jgi:anti-sigma factor RsiW